MNDNLGTRMKGYENISRNYLTKRISVIIRLDGKAFHTFTKGMERPFDKLLINIMQETAKYLCENIQGVKLAYTQSDEISLLLTDFDDINTQGWFDYNIQKMVSISASMATLAFNKFFREKINEIKENCYETDIGCDYCNNLQKKIDKALFDSRCFSIPKEEVCNYFLWRQQDATRNSIQMLGQANFSHKQLHKKSCDMIQNLLLTEKNINWNDLDTVLKRGTCIIKETYFKDEEKTIQRNRWIVDVEIPIFTKDRDYIEKYLK